MRSVRWMLLNMLLVLVLVLPGFLLLMWLFGLMWGRTEPGVAGGENLEAFAFNYFLLIPAALGSVAIQQLGIFVCRRKLPTANLRRVAVVTSIASLVFTPLFGVAPGFLLSPFILVAAIIPLLAFGWIQLLPPLQQARYGTTVT